MGAHGHEMRQIKDDALRYGAALREVSRFLDYEVRSWLPNEHVNCGIDSGCAHFAMEAEMFDKLDAAIDAIDAALEGHAPASDERSEEATSNEL